MVSMFPLIIYSLIFCPFRTCLVICWSQKVFADFGQASCLCIDIVTLANSKYLVHGKPYEYISNELLYLNRAEVECELLLCAWKGNHAARLYLSKHERMHSLNLIAHPVPEYLLPNKNARRSRADNKAQDDEEEKKDELTTAPQEEENEAAIDESQED